MQVLRRLPGLKRLDGVPVEEEEREAALSAGKPLPSGSAAQAAATKGTLKK